MKKWPIQVEGERTGEEGEREKKKIKIQEKKKKNPKKWPRREEAGAAGKLSTLFSAGNRGAWVIYGPCQVEGRGRGKGRACP